MALLLALARNVPQAHASLIAGRWERSQFSGVELLDKTLGILGFGRIGQLVAERAQGFGMRVIAFDPFVGAERYRELGVEKAESSDERLRAGRLPHPAPAQDPRDRGLARRRGARQVQGRRARPQRRPRAADRRRGPRGRAGLGQGRRRGARRLPLRADHRAPAVRPPQRHRHPAPRGLDRRGHRPRRLPGRRAGRRRAHRRRGLERRQRARRRRRGHRGARARSCRSRRQLGRLAMALAEGSSVDRVEVELLGRIAERDTRPLGGRGPARRAHRPHRGGGQRGQRASIAEERGIEIAETAARRRATSPTSCA